MNRHPGCGKCPYCMVGQTHKCIARTLPYTETSAESDDAFLRGCATIGIPILGFIFQFPVAILSLQPGGFNWIPTLVLWSVAIVLIVLVRRS